MKKLLAALTLTFLFSLFSHGQRLDLAVHEGSWSEGTNGGFARVKFVSDGLVFVTRYTYTNGVFTYSENSFGKFTEGKTGLRTFTIQTGTNSVTGSALNGVVKATSKNFVTRATGTLRCDLPPQ